MPNSSSPKSSVLQRFRERLVRWACWSVVLVSGVAAPKNAFTQSAICLHDVTSETGITFRHTDGSSGRRYIVETVSAGLATFDYDGDGCIDIYFPNGAPCWERRRMRHRDTPCIETWAIGSSATFRRRREWPRSTTAWASRPEISITTGFRICT